MKPAAEVWIRRMTLADVDWVMALAESLKDAPRWPQTAYLAALDPQSAPRRLAFVAEYRAEGREAASLAGFAVASLLPPEAELETIAVAAEGQRRGVGKRLFAALAADLQAEGAAEIQLEARDSNLPALGFYRALGFTVAGRRPRYYADPEEDAILLNLRLA